MKKHESREVERYEQPSSLSVVYEGACEEIPVHPTDLSVRGMFIHTPNVFPQGSVLKVRFRLRRPDYEVNVRAEVRHCIPGQGVGVEFLNLSGEAQWAIEEEIGLSVIPFRRRTR